MQVGQKPKPPATPKLETATIAEAIDALGHGISCKRCRKWVEIDLRQIAARLGDELPLTNLRPLLRCNECGVKETIVTCCDIDYFNHYIRRK